MVVITYLYLKMANSILHTKLYRPHIADDFVTREDIFKTLQKSSKKPLTLVSAPAGYGKSVSVSAWLNKSKCKFAWISLGENENDLHQFLSYLLGGIHEYFPGELQDFQKLLAASEIPPVAFIAEVLINDLDLIPDDFVLVLDDYHRIKNQSIHDLLDVLIKYPPQNMHLFILTRRDPPLNLHNLRMYGRMNDVRMADLSFSKKEIDQFLLNVLKVRLEESTINKLLEQTEGWITGLRLATLMVNSKEDPNIGLSKVKGKVKLVSDYILQEVLKNYPKVIRNTLLISALFNRFNSKLIEHLSSNLPFALHASDFTHWLLEANLFTIPLDSENEWFRYHHLFQDILVGELNRNFSKTEIEAVHVEAAKWFDANDFYEEAIDHSLLANNESFAIDIFIRKRYDLMNTEQWNKLGLWIDKFPENVVKANILILSAKCFYLDVKGKFFELIPVFLQFEKSLKQDNNLTDEEQSEIHAHLGEMYIFTDQNLAVKHAKLALKKSAINAVYVRTMAMYWVVIGAGLNGDLELSQNEVNQAKLDAQRFPENCFSRLNIGLSVSLFMAGNHYKMEVVAKEALSNGKKFGFQESIDLGHYFLASSYFLQNRQEEAQVHLDKLIENCYSNRLTYSVISYCLLILCNYKTNQFKNAEKRFHELNAFTGDVDSKATSGFLKGIQLERALYLNDMKIARALLASADLVSLPPLWFSYLPHITKIKAELLFDLIEDPQPTLDYAQQLMTFAEERNIALLKVQLLIVKALYFAKNNDFETSTELIEQALMLGEPGAFTGVFVQYGDRMQSLMDNIQLNTPRKSYLEDIHSQLQISQSTPKSQVRKPDHLEQLTEREQETMQFLAMGLRNKEIAERLFLSPETVKKYLKSCYVKLNVHNRIQAAKKAQELGMI